MAKALTDEQLHAILSQQVKLAKEYDNRERDKSRTKALEYYLGTMTDTPAEPNRSSVVSQDVADTIGWMLPGIMRVFTASDKFVEAEPVEPNDVQGARQATDGLNYTFWKENAGYEICYAATWDALLHGDGIVKTYWDDTPQYAVSFHSGLTEDQRALLLQPGEDGTEPEVLASSERMETFSDPDTGQLVQVPVYDCKIRRQKAPGRFVLEAIPPEDYLVDAEAKSPETASFQAHRSEKTRSELIEMGFDREKVLGIPRKGDWATLEESARETRSPEDSPDTSTERIELYECYVRVDVDGDDESENVRAFFAGDADGVMLDWEVWEDETPFDTIPCEPVPHRFNSRSIFDETQDVQRIKTVLLRQALNNIYATNNPQRLVKGEVKNPEELYTPTFGGTVFGTPLTEILALEVPFVANHAFDAINYQDQVVQRRTGVGRQTMALDPETLQNQTATANQNEHDAAYSQIELVARNMAEWGWRKVFRKLLRLMVKHQTQPRQIRLTGEKFVPIDPRSWNADMDVTINVGLGTGSRDRDAQMLGAVLNQQTAMVDRFMAVGAHDQAIDMLPYIHNTQVKFAEAVGLRNPEAFYPDVTADTVNALKQQAQAAASQPDPKLMLEQAKMQMDVESEKAKAQAAAVKEREQLNADLQTEAQKQQFEREKFNAEMNLRMMELAQQREIELLKLGMIDRNTPDGEGKKPVDATTSMLMDGLGKLGEMMAGMQAMMSAPTEIVRDPQTGRAVGTRRVMN